MKYINQIADYLGVTAQYLLTGNDEILGYKSFGHRNITC